MLCARCDRCGRRSILSAKEPFTARDPVAAPLPVAGPEDERISLRCDLCGSRRVSLRRFASPFEAVAFVNGRI